MFNKLIILLVVIFLTACSSLQNDGSPQAASVTPDETRAASTTSPVLPTFTLQALPSATPEVVQGTLTIWHSWGEDKMPALEQILENFSARYPEVLFDVLYIPQENLHTRFETAVAEQVGPDLLLGPAEWGSSLFQAGMVQDLSSLVDESVTRTISPAAMEAVHFQDSLVGLPYAQQGVILLRNKALIERPAATLDELIRSAKAATQGEIIGADLEQGFFYSGGHLSGLGGKLINDDGSPAFNNDKSLAWIQLLETLGQAGPTEYNSDRDLNLFKEGRAGWIIDGTWNLDALAEAIGRDNLAVDPWPAIQGGNLSGFIQPSNLYLSAQAQEDDRKAAVKFIEHLLSAESQAILNDAGLIPVVSGVKITDPRRAVLLTQVLTALAGGAAYPTIPGIEFYSTALDAALQSILLGDVSPVDALSAAEGVINAALAQANATPTPSP